MKSKNPTENIIFVADMHELIKPNAEARRIYANMQKRTPTERDLKDLYNNSVDPLVEVVKESLKLEDENDETSPIYSLGDMVANRINFGEGTERSVIGKMGKEARELNIPQHEYIAENYTKKKGEVEEWAYRNSFWTKMRFEKISKVMQTADVSGIYRIIHLNGNADTISSFVTRYLLNADFPSPNEIYENCRLILDSHKDKPSIFKLVGFDDYITDENGYIVGEKSFDQGIIIPYTLEWDGQLKELAKIKDGLEGKKPRYSMLLIHESPNPTEFGKKENVEGMAAYEKAFEMLPKDTMIIHGHTHKSELVKYDFKGYETYQIPPNKGVGFKEILKR